MSRKRQSSLWFRRRDLTRIVAAGVARILRSSVSFRRICSVINLGFGVEVDEEAAVTGA